MNISKHNKTRRAIENSDYRRNSENTHIVLSNMPGARHISFPRFEICVSVNYYNAKHRVIYFSLSRNGLLDHSFVTCFIAAEIFCLGVRNKTPVNNMASALSPSDPSSFSRPDLCLVKALHIDLRVDFEKHILLGKVTLKVERKLTHVDSLVGLVICRRRSSQAQRPQGPWPWQEPSCYLS